MIEADEPEWLKASRAFLAFLEEDGEASRQELATHLNRILDAAAPLQLLTTSQASPERDSLAAYRHWYARGQARLPYLEEDELASLDRPEGYRWLMNDVADVAADLDNVCAGWDAGLHEAALWDFRWGFEQHWGVDHAHALLQYLRETPGAPA